MRRGRIALAVLSAAVFTLGGLGTSLAHEDNGAECSRGDKHTASGSCKDPENHQIRCAKEGDSGQVGPAVADIRFYANQTADGGELEACSDGPVGNQNGRLVVQVSQSEQGGRVVLDSDPDQPFDPGWITVQASGKGGNKSGIYCTRDPNESGTKAGDGYAQKWSDPGPDEGADCAPNPPGAP